jgi:chloramphenicol-sensitive protein RarD
MTDAEGARHRAGLRFGLAAYGMWGLFPLYWPLVRPAGSLEILASRMVWSLVCVAVILATRRHWSWIPLLRREPRKIALLGCASLAVTINWGTYIWAVNANHVVDASLGYFINPLVTILFGVVLLRERLRPAQWCAVGIGAAAIVELAIGDGRLPWISLILAFSFGSYGLIKKVAAVPAIESMAVESAFQFLPALAYLIYLQAAGRAVFGHAPWHVTVLLAGAGLVTVVPLIWFAAGAIRLPLSTMGLLQFLTPILQLLCGVFVAHETVPGTEWIGFAIVWLALAVLTYDGLRQARATAERRSAERASDEVVEAMPGARSSSGQQPSTVAE